MSNPQYMVALRRANEVRIARPELKREIRDGSLSIAGALVDPRAASMTVHRLLSSQWQWGQLKSSRVLHGLMIGEHRQVQELTERQRAMLAAACEPIRRGGVDV